MKTIVGLCAACALFTLSLAPAAASWTGMENISGVHYMTDSVLFYHSGTREGTIPACATGNPTRWLINLSQPGGKAQAAAIMFAKAMNKKIAVTGTDTCIGWGTETVSYLYVQD